MFNGFSQATIDFMWGIRFNNEKPWFEAHKDEYRRDFLAPMKDLGSDVFARLDENLPGRGFVCKFSRIYKDARRLRGGGPYRDNLWFSIERPAEDWKEAPVFWFELSPEHWDYGLGYYSARPETMAKLRARIERAPKKFEALISPLTEQDEFMLEGPDYARKKPAPSEKTAGWYNKKSFSLIHTQANGPELFSPELAEQIAEGFRFLMPYYDYFESLDGDATPVKL